MNSFYFRFANLVLMSHLDRELTWKHIRSIKASNYKREESDCTLLYLSNEDIIENLNNLSQLLNVSNLSNEVRNVSVNSINEAGEMYIYLNSCPKDIKDFRGFWEVFYLFNLMGKQVSSIILTLIKTITYSTEDGRNIAKTILQKLFDEMNITPNEFKRLTDSEIYNLKLLKGLTSKKFKINFFFKRIALS